MRIKIVDVHNQDAHYEWKKYVIGSTGDVVEKSHRGGGWYFLILKNCSYEGITIDTRGKLHGFGKEGDNSCYGRAKFERVE